jgi:hypothetical protein
MSKILTFEAEPSDFKMETFLMNLGDFKEEYLRYE